MTSAFWSHAVRADRCPPEDVEMAVMGPHVARPQRAHVVSRADDPQLCPITLQRMSSIATADIYLASDGARYDRGALASWLRLNPTSPINRNSMLQDLVALGILPRPHSSCRAGSAVSSAAGVTRGPSWEATLMLSGFMSLLAAAILAVGRIQGARYVALTGASLMGCSAVLKLGSAVLSRGRPDATTL